MSKYTPAVQELPNDFGDHPQTIKEIRGRGGAPVAMPDGVDAPNIQALEADVANRVEIAKQVGGGLVPRPLRVPTLTVERMFPNRNLAHRIAWVDGDTVYSYGRDRSIRKSADGGDTWEVVGTENKSLLGQGAFLKTDTGTLLTIQNTTPQSIVRSTDDGQTWDTVHTFRSDTRLLGAQSWAIDWDTGYIYYGEYQTTDAFTGIRVYRSTDDGATWQVFHEFIGPATGGASSIRHIHGVQWDPFSRRIYIMTGDPSPAAGIYRVSANGNGVEPVVLNEQVVAEHGPDAARAIALMFFPTHIAWAADSTTTPYIYRMARDQIGVPSPVVEAVYRINATGWFTVQAAADGSKWLVSATSEGSSAIDSAAHLYAVEDNGATVYEVGSYEARDEYTTIAPVGLAEMHGDGGVVWLQGHNTRHYVNWKARYTYSTTPLLRPEEPPLVYAWETQSSGPQVLTQGKFVVFGATRRPLTNRVLKIFDMGAYKVSGDGLVNVRIVKTSDGSVLAQTSTLGRRQASREEAGGALYEFDLATSPTDIEFQIYCTSGDADGNAYVTYGWGE